MNHLDLFSGIGGFALAGRWAWGEEHNVISFCETDKFCTGKLKKHWPKVPCHDDIKTLNAEKWRGTIDLVTGGFPCQPYSLAGKRAGAADDRALWPEMFRVTQECRPRWVVGENVPGIVNMALDTVLDDLESIGYEVWPIVIPACAVDAPHIRSRVWILAHADESGSWGNGGNAVYEGRGASKSRRKSIQKATGRANGAAIGNTQSASTDDVADANKPRSQRRIGGELQERSGEWPIGAGSAYVSNAALELQHGGRTSGQRRRGKSSNNGEDVSNSEGQRCSNGDDSKLQRQASGEINTPSGASCITRELDSRWWPVEPAIRVLDDGLSDGLAGYRGRIATGIPDRVNKLKALGNAIVPQVAYEIFRYIRMIDHEL